MVYWRFLDFISPSGRNQITRWYERLPSVQAKADFDVLLEDLEVVAMWSMPEFRMLTGKKLAGLGELRFETDNVQHRVVGFYGPTERDFTLLIGCTHKQRTYKPHSALDTATKRKKMVESDHTRVVLHE